MTEHESSQPDPNRGGLAPEARQCRYVLSSGDHCRCWAIRGHEFCRRHARWQEARIDGPMEIPLMEDPAARRERPFADYLHHCATAPPPPIPTKADPQTGATPKALSS